VIPAALAACLAAMMQANWLINTVGKASGSFVALDLMRKTLRILAGVGFIGGGGADDVRGLRPPPSCGSSRWAAYASAVAKLALLWRAARLAF
jgi:hypothetical protein